MMLVEEGKLGLDDPVSKYLDGTPSRWKRITIRHLLTHTSGIPDFNNENIRVDDGPGDFDQRVLNTLARRRLHFAPGEEYRYSNSNYHLLGMIIQEITGKPYGDFMRERIFEPLGMTRTTISPENGIYPGLASGYTWNNAFHRVAAPIGITAGGSILSSISDMAKWDAALYTDTLLKKSSLQQMWAPVRLNDGMTWRYGFGWAVGRINDHLIVSHTGNIIGFSSAIERNVDDCLTVILLDNRFDSQEVAGKLAYNIARLYLWTGPHYQPIPDKEPKITDRVHWINDRFDHGKLSAADFTPLMWSELSPWRKQAEQDGKTLISRIWPAGDAELVEQFQFAPEFRAGDFAAQQPAVLEIVRVTCSGVSLRNSMRKCRTPSSIIRETYSAPVCASALNTVLRQPTSAFTGCSAPTRSRSFTSCRRTGGRSSGNPCRSTKTRRTRSAPCETSACAGGW
jgi:hypothetical protein